jgi:tight adherence protein B
MTAQALAGTRLAEWLARALAPLRLAGSAGLVPSRSERRRLALLLGTAALFGGLVLVGTLTGVVAGACAAVSTSRVVAARQRLYARRIDAGVARAALTVADGLSGGRSVRGSLEAAAGRLDGPIGLEFRRLESDMALGLTTDEALGRLRRRCRSRRVDVLVAAIRLQRRSGGDLTRLLREIAAAADEAGRLHDEARAATAQARFTGLLVIGFGPCTVILAELAAPGTLDRVTGSAAGLTLVGAAALMQAGGALAVGRISRVSV